MRLISKIFSTEILKTAKIMSSNNSPRPLVICGPSGVGKSTLLTRLFQEYPTKFGFSVSHTTREPRRGEINAMHYYFTDRDSMLKAIDNDEFLESATFGGNIYGTSRTAVERVQKKGLICVLDIEMEGVKQVKKSNLNAWFVFIMPPTVDDLKKRLLDRNTETNQSVQARLARAIDEIEYSKQPNTFDKVIINDDQNRAYIELKQFIMEKYTNTFTN